MRRHDKAPLAAPPALPGDRALFILAVASCCCILVAKSLLIWRINFNWDEFYFLANVHALVRGDGVTVLNSAYTHLFAWLPGRAGAEPAQLIIARSTAMALFVLSSLLLYRLARSRSSPPAAALAVLCYLSMWPVLKHAGSFRADSLLLPLFLLNCVLCAPRTGYAGTAAAPGVVFGLCFVITIKAVLLLPLLAVLIWARPDTTEAPLRARAGIAARQGLLFALLAAATAATLLLAHYLSMPGVSFDFLAEKVSTAVRATVVDPPFMPRREALLSTFHADKLSWCMIGAGFLVALVRRQIASSALALSLLPVLFYRNAFPYYYVVMLAPASVLAAISADALRQAVWRRLPTRAAFVFPYLIVLGLAIPATDGIAALRFDEQAAQRSVIAAVHDVFPIGVTYLDHSGMIASFRKVNFFMSTWGVASYQASDVPSIAAAIRRDHPPLLLANTPMLDPGSRAFHQLRPEDQTTIRQSYVHYWGPLWVAGSTFEVMPGGHTTVTVPFDGNYRLAVSGAIRVNGILRESGDVLPLPSNRNSIEVEAGRDAVGLTSGRLIWADAKAPPGSPPPSAPLYTGL